jgi:hypothetical protein
LAALNGPPALDKDIKALSIQLYNTSSLLTSIALFTNSLNGEEKMNFPLTKELPLRNLMEKVT